VDGLNYGGQAAPEGVMMRGPEAIAVAVRRPDGSLATLRDPRTGRLSAGRSVRAPLLRGVVRLWETLALGLRATTFAAKVAAGAEERHTDRRSVALAVAVSLLLAFALFIVLPFGAARLLGAWTGSGPASSVLEGSARLLAVVLYIQLVVGSREMRRVFGYHGAEHKTLNAHEAGEPLEVERVFRQKSCRGLCDVGFVLTALVVSGFLPTPLAGSGLWAAALARVAGVLVSAAVWHELLLAGDRHRHHWCGRALLAPCLALQGLTIREPDRGMIETAITALELVRPEQARPAQGFEERAQTTA
jgi:uncharacterized protein YqhQ